MSRGNERTIRLYTITLIVVVIVAGAAYTSVVYLPWFEAEQTRLRTLNVEAAPLDLDPALAFDLDSLRVIANVFDGLTTYMQGTTDVAPCLAASWSIPDPITYIFTLRQDVSFHDGTPFNASCVEYSFNRVLSLEGPSSYLFGMVDQIEATGPYTVQITLFTDFAPFLSILANPVASIISPTAAEALGEAFDEQPVGTGPFKFDHWSQGNELVLVANDAYFQGPPQLKKIVFNTILEASARTTALELGEADIIVSSRVPPADLPELTSNPDLEVLTGVGMDIEYLGFNMLKPPLNDSRVREAIAYAIDYDAIINDAMEGYAARIGGPIPPNILGYKVMPLTQRNVTKASQLLADAGYADGFTITLTYNIESLSRYRIAERIRDSLDDVGITVSIKGLDWDSAIGEYLAMGHELMLNDWFPDYFDPDAYLSPQFHSWSAAPYGANIFGLADPDIDALIDAGLQSTNTTERKQIYSNAQDKIVAALPCVFLFVTTEFDVIRYNVENWVFSPSQIIEFYEVYKQ